MTTNLQAQMIKRAGELDLITHAEIRSWIDTILAGVTVPDEWMIELSTCRSSHLVDHLRIIPFPALRSPETDFDIVVSCHAMHRISIEELVHGVFAALISTHAGGSTMWVSELVDLLVEWDCQEFPTITQEFGQRFISAITRQASRLTFTKVLKDIETNNGSHAIGAKRVSA